MSFTKKKIQKSALEKRTTDFSDKKNMLVHAIFGDWANYLKHFTKPSFLKFSHSGPIYHSIQKKIHQKTKYFDYAP